MREQLNVCAVIPAFNEERHVGDVVRACRAQGLRTLVVDDCSADATAERAREAGAEVVRHERNRGKGGALSTGFAWASAQGYDAVITLDGDGQHDPAEIRRFIDCAQRRGADIVVGSRFLRGARALPGTKMPPERRITNWFMSAVISWIAGVRLTDTQSGYRLVKTRDWDALGLGTHGFDTESEMLMRACRAGMRVCEVPIRTIYGDEKSSIRPGRDTVRWIGLLLRLRRQARERRRKARG